MAIKVTATVVAQLWLEASAQCWFDEGNVESEGQEFSAHELELKGGAGEEHLKKDAMPETIATPLTNGITQSYLGLELTNDANLAVSKGADLHIDLKWIEEEFS